MRKGIEVRLGPGDRERLKAVIGSGNSPQKHVWRARIVLLSADGVGTMAIQRHTGKGRRRVEEDIRPAINLFASAGKGCFPSFQSRGTTLRNCRPLVD